VTGFHVTQPPADVINKPCEFTAYSKQELKKGIKKGGGGKKMMRVPNHWSAHA
jgi:hypothetical protein